MNEEAYGSLWKVFWFLAFVTLILAVALSLFGNPFFFILHFFISSFMNLPCIVRLLTRFQINTMVGTAEL